jgi:KipI family sensor histidine kinase inhibitor
MSAVRVEFLGDCALLLRLGERIDGALNARVHAVAQALRDAALPGVRDIVPAYASIAVHYDPAAWLDPAGADTPSQRAAQLCDFVENCNISAAGKNLPAVEIPICYGGPFGPDLAEIAAHAQLDVDTVIALHTAGAYRVAMLGFAPGFPYLLGLDPKLHTPRRAHPRTRVPAGSVGIGGAQTGIYPRELPGGWQIIGRTPLLLFDPARDSPALLAPGQRVRFRAVDADEYAMPKP